MYWVSICRCRLGSDGRLSSSIPANCGLVDGRVRPEVGGEEGHRALEVPRVQEQRPRLVSGRDVLAVGRRFGRRQRQRQIAVAEEFAAGALLEIQAVGRPEQPGAQLGHAVLARRPVPVPALARAGAVGPFHEVRGHPAHDELRRLRREPRVAPPSQPALDVGIELLRGRLLEPGEHPRAEQARLEAIARVGPQQGPGGDVHREAAAERLGDPFRRDDQVSRHLARPDRAAARLDELQHRLAHRLADQEVGLGIRVPVIALAAGRSLLRAPERPRADERDVAPELGRARPRRPAPASATAHADASRRGRSSRSRR